jgi:hypothetical protein
MDFPGEWIIQFKVSGIVLELSAGKNEWLEM